ncbi:MAG: sodium:solute symporter, partial [Alistipes sp.]|nr:sodium:solute symporter [Alistipes sp.]
MLSPVAILLTLAGYVVLLLLVARLSVRRTSNSSFFMADRRLAWYQLWPAMISAAMSGVTFVSVPGSVAADGFSYLQMVAGFTVGQVVVAYWLVPLFYGWGYRSIYEYFGDRYG